MIDVVFNSVDRSTFERIHAHQVFAKLKVCTSCLWGRIEVDLNGR